VRPPKPPGRRTSDTETELHEALRAGFTPGAPRVDVEVVRGEVMPTRALPKRDEVKWLELELVRDRVIRDRAMATLVDLYPDRAVDLAELLGERLYEAGRMDKRERRTQLKWLVEKLDAGVSDVE
jgi:hypothetical protein